MGTYPVVRDLPAAHCKEIGRIIHRFAFCEMLLRTIAYNLILIGPKVGRIAVRQPRAADHVTMLKDLEHLMGVDLKVNWGKLSELLKEAESYRDRLAHGIWLKHPDFPTPVLQDFSRAYVNAQALPKGMRKGRIDPIAIPLTVEKLRGIAENIDRLGNMLSLIETKTQKLGELRTV